MLDGADCADCPSNHARIHAGATATDIWNGRAAKGRRFVPSLTLGQGEGERKTPAVGVVTERLCYRY